MDLIGFKSNQIKSNQIESNPIKSIRAENPDVLQQHQPTDDADDTDDFLHHQQQQPKNYYYTLKLKLIILGTRPGGRGYGPFFYK